MFSEWIDLICDKRPISWLLSLTLLFFPSYPKSLILLLLSLLLLPSLLLLFFLLLVYSSSFLPFFTLSLFFLSYFRFTILIFLNLVSTAFKIPCYFHLLRFLVDLKVIVSKPWHYKDYIPLLPSYHTNLYSFPMSLVKYIHIHCIFY